MKEAVIKISPNGEKVEIDIQGVQGPACADIQKRIAQVLGEVTEEKRKAEFYQTAKEGIKTGG